MTEGYAVRKGEFSWALELLKQGKRVCRRGWNGRGMWLVLLKRPGSFNIGGAAYPMQSYVAMKTMQSSLVPWLCSQTDLLADDWEEVE
ncbi:DUF2829 domain-containing protein [Candidatus Poriferisocius sp.]|uniref:DUF2829 domain-containing protein n=1 Tax=Candidatus Poriferisocius sp. TaxID=3101276 RepID=UPI003B02075D